MEQLPDDLIRVIKSFVGAERIYTLHRLKLLYDIIEIIEARTTEEWFEHWKKNKPFYLPKLIKVCKKSFTFEITRREEKQIVKYKNDYIDEEWFANYAIYGQNGLLEIKEKREALYKGDLYPVYKLRCCENCNTKFHCEEYRKLCSNCKNQNL
jgi:hypothetical protein